MASLNRAEVIGNMTRDPEVKTIPSGQQVASFSVATNHSYTDKGGQKVEKAEFHNIVAWGKLAEICGKFLAKGRKVYIAGRLQTREWEGQDGTKRNRTEIIAENMILLDKPPLYSQAAAGAPVTTQPEEPPAEEIPVADIPF